MTVEVLFEFQKGSFWFIQVLDVETRPSRPPQPNTPQSQFLMRLCD
jgi:hypothetical protein